ARPVPGGGQSTRDPAARIPGVVPPPDLPPAADADDEPQGPDRVRLDGGPLLPEGHRAAGLAAAPPRTVPTGVGEAVVWLGLVVAGCAGRRGWNLQQAEGLGRL